MAFIRHLRLRQRLFQRQAGKTVDEPEELMKEYYTATINHAQKLQDFYYEQREERWRGYVQL